MFKCKTFVPTKIQKSIVLDCNPKTIEFYIAFGI